MLGTKRAQGEKTRLLTSTSWHFYDWCEDPHLIIMLHDEHMIQQLIRWGREEINERLLRNWFGGTESPKGVLWLGLVQYHGHNLLLPLLPLPIPMIDMESTRKLCAWSIKLKHEYSRARNKIGVHHLYNVMTCCFDSWQSLTASSMVGDDFMLHQGVRYWVLHHCHFTNRLPNSICIADQSNVTVTPTLTSLLFLQIIQHIVHDSSYD